MWENTDGFDDQLICATYFYLMSMLLHEYNTIIERTFTVRAPYYGIYVVDDLNFIV